MPIVPIGAYDTPGGPYRVFYVPKAGGTYTFPLKMVGTLGGVVLPDGVYPFSCRPLQAFMDISYRPSGYITGFTEGVGGFTAFPNAGPLPNNAGRVDLMATNPFIDGAIGGTADPFGIPVYQFGVEAWVPPYSFDPIPVSWTPGDPPPSPWVDGDPVPDGWTPPDGYVPADTCTYGITPEEVIVPYVAGSAMVDINSSGPDCAWTTLPNDGWIFGTYSGTGTQTREISWTANLTSATRIGTVTMAGLTFMVIQLPPPPPDNISIQTGCHGASVTLTWDTMPSAVGYNIYRDGSLIASVSALAQTYTDTGVLIGTRYSYQIETRYPSSVVGTRSDKYFKTPCTTCPVDDLSDWQSLCAVDTKYSPVVSAWEETCGSEQKWTQVSIPAPLFKEKVVSP